MLGSIGIRGVWGVGVYRDTGGYVCTVYTVWGVSWCRSIIYSNMKYQVL